MSRRFYLPQALDVPRVFLQGREAHHLTNVLRGKLGDEVLLFDGNGIEARARIVGLQPSGAADGGGTAELEILSHGPAESETRQPIILATAVPKGDRFEWLVEKATELGVSRLIPLVTDRSIVNPGEGKLDKLRNTVIAASKQCRRSRLMEITAPLSWSHFLTQEAGAGQLYMADPSGESMGSQRWGTDRPIILTIGPEGGFTEREISAAVAAGAGLVSLGPRILRIETAAVALAAVVGACLESSDTSQS